MRVRTPRRLGLKRDMGHPAYMMLRMVKSGRELKVPLWKSDIR